ncbi:MAG TPA: hypothetical protein VIY73_24685, partial [Polyangiaceae bacterium]
QQDAVIGRLLAAPAPVCVPMPCTRPHADVWPRPFIPQWTWPWGDAPPFPSYPSFPYYSNFPSDVISYGTIAQGGSPALYGTAWIGN